MLEIDLTGIKGKDYCKLENLYSDYLLAKTMASRIFIISSADDAKTWVTDKDTISSWQNLYTFYARLVKYDISKMQEFERKVR